jgi:urea carboxylase-associated protein 2
MSDTATTRGARDHARAQERAAAAQVTAKPTIPARLATDLPTGLTADRVVWDETLGAGDYAGRVLERGWRLRLENLGGDGCVNLLVMNADQPAERLNVADTVKVQWRAYLDRGALLLSDMGRVLMSITEDTCGNHDTFCGASTAKSNAAKYGHGAAWGSQPAARDRFLLALAKFGLGRRDIGPNVNLFKRVTVEADGGLTFVERSSAPGQHVELRAEMRVLVVLANTPHVLDPGPTYSAGPVRVLAYRGPVTPADDPIRTSTPERRRAFENTEDYYADRA